MLNYGYCITNGDFNSQILLYILDQGVDKLSSGEVLKWSLKKGFVDIYMGCYER